MKRLLLLTSALTLYAGAAFAQQPPAATPPYNANTSFTCLPPNNVPATCTVGNVGQTSNVTTTRATFSQNNIGANKTIILTGYLTAGDSGMGAIYSSIGATSTGINAIQDAGGVWFNEIFPNGVVVPGEFGAKADDGATTVASGDITANPQWRGTYVVGDTWDTVGVNEAVYAAFAGANSTPGHIAWNAPGSNAQNKRLVLPTGNYGVNEQMLWTASFFDIEFQTPAACLVWTGPSTTTPMKLNSFAYGPFENFCLTDAVRLHQSLTYTPILIIDHDGGAPAGTLASQQLDFRNCQINATGQGINGVSINPIGGNNAQGSVIGFHQCEFNGNSAAQFAIRNNGSNALANYCQACDFIGWEQDGVQNSAGAFDLLLPVTMENENLIYGGFSSSPQTFQPETNGSDFHSFSAAGSNISHVNETRSEAYVAIRCVQGACTSDSALQMADADMGGAWTAHRFQQPSGSWINPSNAANTGQIFTTALTGGPQNGNTSIGWRNINSTSSACRVDDNGPGSTGWSNGQWDGYGVFERFTNGSTFSASAPLSNPILWNSATQVGWCVETNSSIAGTAGNPVVATVNSISNGGNNIAAGDTLLDPFGFAYGTIASPTGPGGVGSWTLNFNTASETMSIGAGPAVVAAQISGTVLTVTKVHSGPNIQVGDTILDRNNVSLGTIASYGSGTGGLGSYNVNINIASETMEIGPVPASLSVGNDEYLIAGLGGATLPTGYASAQGSYVLGQTDGGGNNIGCTVTAGSTAITCTGAGTLFANGNIIMIPNGSFVGACTACAEIRTGFFAVLSGVSGNNGTLSVPADLNLTKVSAYLSTPVTDGQLTDMMVDFNTFEGVQGLKGASFSIGRGANLTGYQNITNGNQSWNRGGGANHNGTLWNDTAGYIDQQEGFCPAPVSGVITLTPGGTANTITCSLTANETFNINPGIPGYAARLNLVLTDNGVSHLATFGTGFKTNTPSFYTPGNVNATNNIPFIFDGTATWEPLSEPLLVYPRRPSSNWYSSPGRTVSFTVASTTTTYFAPFIVNRVMTVENLGVLVLTGQASSDIQLAIYPDNGTGSPLLTNGPLASTGNISTASSSTNVSGSVTPVTLTVGLYWAAIMGNNASLAIEGYTNDNTNGFSTYAGANSQNNLITAANGTTNGYTLIGQTFGTFPTSGSVSVNGGAIGPQLQAEAQ